MALSIHARMIPFTLIDFRFAQFALVAIVTVTRERTNTVHTTPVLARIVFAFVHIDLALLSNYARHTNALVATGIFIGEWLRKYRRQFGESFRQRVQSSVRSFQALPIVHTRRTLTLIDIAFAILSVISVVTSALIIVDQVQAKCTVFTRHRNAFVDVHFAIVAGESGSRTIASESTQFVFALASVLTGL